MNEFEIIPAYNHLQEVKTLLREYVDLEYERMLGIKLEFQNITAELENPQEVYPPETGGLYLITWHNQAPGCIAFRRLDAGNCEIKRLYVRSAYRGHQLGEKALHFVLTEAANMYYQFAYCDTLASKSTALNLYKKVGFTETKPYYFNPLADVVYLKKSLIE